METQTPSSKHRTIAQMLRLPNLVIIALTLVLLKHLVLYYRLPDTLGSINFYLLLASTLLIAAAGYIINDWVDLPIDRINKPEKVYIGTWLGANATWWTSFSLSALALGIAVSLTFRMHSVWPLILLTLATGVVWWYAYILKRKLWWGNLAVSCMTSSTILMLWWLGRGMAAYRSGVPFTLPGPDWIMWGFGVFAFFTTLLREIIKDMEDVPGDLSAGCRSLPIVYGNSLTIGIIAGIGMFTLLLIGFSSWKLYQHSQALIALWLVMVCALPILYIMVRLPFMASRKALHHYSTLLKWVMVGGLLSPLVAHLISHT